jgi:orotidine-5'-phosphate decarboxylase
MLSAIDRIVFPLDMPTAKDARPFVKKLMNKVGMFKVGLELFITEGPAFVQELHEKGAKVFLDLKLHDIPVTVKRACERVASLNVKFLTVHCGENEEMLAAAVKGAGDTQILGVTVLTSVSKKHLHNAGYAIDWLVDVTKLAQKRAKAAKAAGCLGVVCSGKDVAAIKSFCGLDFITMVPGIRPAWYTAKDDQERITTPAQAIRSGADYLVIGRPIRDAKDPVDTVKRITEEIESVL